MSISSRLFDRRTLRQTAAEAFYSMTGRLTRHGPVRATGAILPLQSAIVQNPLLRDVATIGLPIATLLALSFLLFPASGRDDSHITYWAAHALSRFGEIVNYNGERVEQASSLLHVLVLAVAARLSGLALPTLGPIIGILSSALALVYTHKLASVFVSGPLAFATTMIVATSVYFVYWTTGGLESTLAALAVTYMVYHLVRFIDAPGVGKPGRWIWLATAMFLLVRPEAFFVVTAALIGCLVPFLIRMIYVDNPPDSYDRSVVAKLLYLFLPVAVLGVGLFLFRYFYFGALFPQPVTAKIADVPLARAAEVWESISVALSKPQIVVIVALVLMSATYALYYATRRARSAEGARRLSLLVLVQVVTAASAIGLLIFLARHFFDGLVFPHRGPPNILGIWVSSPVNEGWLYLYEALSAPHFMVVSLLALAGGVYGLYRLVKGPATYAGLVLLSGLTLALMASVALSPGDWMEGGRFVVSAVPLLAVLAAIGLSTVLRKRSTLPVIVVIVALQIVGIMEFARDSSTSLPIWRALALQVDAPTDGYSWITDVSFETAAGLQTNASTDGFSWFEKANRSHLRDIPLVNQMNSAIHTLQEQGSKPTTIMSELGGMVPYHLARAHFGEFEFIDRLGLITRHFTSCPATTDVPVDKFGSRVYLDFYFESQALIEAECGIRPPDLIFEIGGRGGTGFAASLEENGYEVIWSLSGSIPSQSRLKGRVVNAGQVIAVREDLAYLFN